MITKEGIDYILAAERFEPHPYWPGGESGITLGYGYDIGYATAAQLYTDWIEPGFIMFPNGPIQSTALVNACGKRGASARAVLDGVRGAIIIQPDALEVFETISLPKYEAQTRAAFPGVESLPDAAYSALVSLVFNRGSDMGQPGLPSWERRSEMREIRRAVADRDLRHIAEELRSMKRLWVGQGLDGLIARREAEAKMVESALA